MNSLYLINISREPWVFYVKSQIIKLIVYSSFSFLFIIQYLKGRIAFGFPETFENNIHLKRDLVFVPGNTDNLNDMTSTAKLLQEVDTGYKNNEDLLDNIAGITGADDYKQKHFFYRLFEICSTKDMEIRKSASCFLSYESSMILKLR